MEALEYFIADIDEELAPIEAETDKLNIFDILGVSGYEIRHSNFLAWLLNPNENHGLGDYFLKKFLKDIIRNHNLENFTLFDIERFDLNNSEIRREWRNIDILILNESEKFVCVIENKVYSKESKSQCEKYRILIEKEFPKYKKLYVLLSIDGVDSQDNEYYLSYKYEQVHNLLKKVLENKEDNLNNITRIFINNYIDTINKKMVEDSEIKKICREIYKNHKKALDLIIENKPDRDNEIYLIIGEVLRELKNEGENIELDDSSKYISRFYPKEFKNIPKLNGFNRWTSSKLHLLFEIKTSPDESSKMKLNFVLGGKDEAPVLSSKVNEMMKSNPKGKVWNSFHQKDILGKNYREKEDEEISSKIKEKLKEYLESQEYKNLVNDVIKICNELDSKDHK